jgi:hypothetical protein
MIMNLKVQVEEARRIEETYKNLLEENKCLEDEILAQRKEADKIEEISKIHLKEISKDLNDLEAQVSQQEGILEEEIISLNIQLRE